MENNKQQETYQLTEQSIKERIIQFNLDSTIDELKRYYSTPSTWEIIQKSRSETCHTQFLAWFFGNKDFNTDTNASPIKRLIVLLLKWAENQKKAFFDESLAKSVYNQNLYIESYSVGTEVHIDDPSYKDGYIDILIKCRANIKDDTRNINIVIENKVDATETTKKKSLYQTDAYYNYITKEHEDDINLFVFLKPNEGNLEDITEAECHCKKYIQINYQELLDNIIQPISELKDISEENRFRLKDYIKALGKPSDQFDNNNEDKDSKITSKRTIIMAMEQKEKELLATFFANNEDLIRASIDALGNEELSKSMAKIERKATRCTINGKGNGDEFFTMHQVVEEFIKFRLKDNIRIKDIDEEIRGFLNTKVIKVGDSDSPVENGDEKRFKEKKIEGQIIRYSTQWGEGGTNPTFTKFRNGVNKKYPDFKIECI